MRLAFPITVGLVLTSAFCAAQPVRPPIASNPVVTIEGKIQKVRIAQGQGMPYLELRSQGQLMKVYLGPVRYLMEQNFNPTSGTQIRVTGYKMNPDIIAIRITIPSERRTLQLRDEDGFPLWRGLMMQGKGATRR